MSNCISGLDYVQYNSIINTFKNSKGLIPEDHVREVYKANKNRYFSIILPAEPEYRRAAREIEFEAHDICKYEFRLIRIDMPKSIHRLIFKKGRIDLLLASF